MNSTFNYHYSLNDAERWAEFSGDYNPIHFDLQQAQHLGQVQLTVHGMRAMLDIKYQLSTALLPLLPGVNSCVLTPAYVSRYSVIPRISCNSAKRQGR